MRGTATIINYNANAHGIVSAAGRLSTTEGSADEIYDRSLHNEDEINVNLIRKILSSGHESVLEHIMVNISFDNVSVYVEQFMIEFRLASFTVKSRRYVDFGKAGYVSPDFSKYDGQDRKVLENLYTEHMDYLFDEYNYFVQAGVPKEDARFVLPYGFRSNFYCTVNARELIKIVNEMVYGRGKNFPELVMLGKSLFLQCEKNLPYLNIEKPQEDTREEIRKYLEQEYARGEAGGQTGNMALGQAAESVTLLYGPEHPEQIICRAAALNSGFAGWAAVDLDREEQQEKIISELFKNARKRELEQVHFSILFHRVSLAGITHLVRHRMQSIVIPDYVSTCDFEHYVLPESIVKLGLETRYRQVFDKSRELVCILKEKGFDPFDQVYLLLSGLEIPVMTTMNANELYTFIRLRTCNRAQWEIKACADALLSILRRKHPVLFYLFGPSCYVMGRCPEGRMSCKKMEEVCRHYGEGKEVRKEKETF